MLIYFKYLLEKYNLKINGVIIAGAHQGNEIETYVKHEIRNIIAFEPVLSNFRILQKRWEKFNFHLIPFALGAAPGKAEMFIESANEGQSCSILEPELHKVQYPHIVFNEKETVYISTLDIEIPLIEDPPTAKSQQPKANFLDIDCQGYELEVLKGATETLKTIDYIYTEVYRNNVYKGNPMITEIDNYLAPFGFTRVETNWDGQTWGDAFYIKK